MSDRIEFVEVGDSKYRVIKTGRAQAEQALLITKWLSKHGMKAMKEINTGDNLQTAAMGGFEFFTGLIEHLSVDAIIDLFQAITGCTKEEAELYFDTATLIEVTLEVINYQPSVRRLIDRFFSKPKSSPGSEELSTTSEPPMDGPTT